MERTYWLCRECTSRLGVFTTHQGLVVCADAKATTDIHGGAGAGDQVKDTVFAGPAARAGLQFVANGFQRVCAAHYCVANFAIRHRFAYTNVQFEAPIPVTRCN